MWEHKIQKGPIATWYFKQNSQYSPRRRVNAPTWPDSRFTKKTLPSLWWHYLWICVAYKRLETKTTPHCHGSYSWRHPGKHNATSFPHILVTFWCKWYFFLNAVLVHQRSWWLFKAERDSWPNLTWTFYLNVTVWAWQVSIINNCGYLFELLLELKKRY